MLLLDISSQKEANKEERKIQNEIHNKKAKKKRNIIIRSNIREERKFNSFFYIHIIVNGRDECTSKSTNFFWVFIRPRKISEKKFFNC